MKMKSISLWRVAGISAMLFAFWFGAVGAWHCVGVHPSLTSPCNAAIIGGGAAILLSLAAAYLASRARAYEFAAKTQAPERDAELRRRTEQRLRDSEERLSMVLDAANLGFWIRDVGADSMFCNRQWGVMLGYAEGALKESFETWRELIHPDDAPRVLAMHTAHFEGKTPRYECEYRVKTASGGWKWIMSAGRVVERDADGQPARVAGVHIDIDARKRAEESVRESETRYRQLFQSLQSGFALHEIICDEDGVPVDYRFLEVNPAFEQLTGLKSADIVGRTVREVLPSTETRWIRTYGQVALTGGTVAFEDYHAQLDRHFEVTAFCPKKGQFAVIFADITARVQTQKARIEMESRLMQAQKLESLGVLAGGIAHDFNNLLMGMLGNADIVLDRMNSQLPEYGCVKDIEVAAKRAADLCRQMLAYSGKGHFMVEPFNLNDVIREMSNLIQVSIGKTAILKFNLADNLPNIRGDVTQVRQVVMNLLTNASEAIGNSSGVISVETGARNCTAQDLRSPFLAGEHAPGDYVYIEVADTGCGMDEGTLAKVFDPFFTTKFTGRGLGLAVVLGIVRGHNGSITVKTVPGKGTRFRVLFPAGPAARKEDPPPRAPEPAESKGGTILLVDDDETVLTVAGRMLERGGYKVVVAHDGREGVDAFRERAAEIACVILDLTMPHMNGEDALVKMRKIRADVPVLISSGYNEQEIESRFRESGINGFIQKPYQSAQLMMKVRAAMAAQPTTAPDNSSTARPNA